MLRALLAGIAFIILTIVLVAMLLILRAMRLPGRGVISQAYSRMICALLGVRITVQGALSTDRAVLVVANHVSWLDILVIAATAPTIFVAKSEVAGWPLVGIAARARGTVFVDRQRRHRSEDTNGEIAAQLAAGAAIVLFAEGTSSDGNRVLPFRSSLFGAVRQAGVEGIRVQPLSIAYLRIHGLPMGRRHRPVAAWYGDMDLAPHLVDLMKRGPLDVTLTWGDIQASRPDADRKALAQAMEQAVRRITTDVLRGRPAAVRS